MNLFSEIFIFSWILTPIHFAKHPDERIDVILAFGSVK